MKKILISWMGIRTDFNDIRINMQGPTLNFHQYFYQSRAYSKHLILSNEKESTDSKSSMLRNAINSTFPESIIELIYLNLDGPDVIDFNKIHSKVYPFILELSDYKIDILVSTGTPTMQVVWYIIAQEFNNINLLQTIKKEDTSSGSPKLVEIKINQSL
ncbi:MAG: hypothetical protein JNM67_07840, partial [Bacteroidetes bacterium]|nr:hypothetical protein [Bacteroidota bacterium]